MRHFCFECGAALEPVMQDGRLREICPACGWVHYDHLKLSSSARVVQDGCLLLVLRARQPWRGCWYMPAGYVEVDEDPAGAAARETWEETGLRVAVGRLLKTYTYQDDPRGAGVVFHYEAQPVGGELRTSSESAQVGFFTPAQIAALPLAGASADRQIADWLAEQLQPLASNPSQEKTYGR